MYYFDHSATTPLHPHVLELMTKIHRDIYGNPSSTHSQGRQAKAVIELSRRQIAKAINARPEQIIFTSGGTEANNQVFWSRVNQDKNHIITDSIEHPAVLKVLSQLDQFGLSHSAISVDNTGSVYVKDIESSIRPETGLISIMLANNEIGTIQPIAEIAQLAMKNQVLLHTDAVQCLGKMKVDVQDLGADFLSLSAHKFYGPKGIGVLYIRNKDKISPLLIGGGQERGLRAGTENIASIAGMGLAADLCTSELEKHVSELSDLETHFKTNLNKIFPSAVYHGNLKNKLPGLVSVSFPGYRSDILLAKLDRKQMAVSSGSACGSGIVKPSTILSEIGVDDETNISTLRISFGRSNTIDQIDSLLTELNNIFNS